MITDYVIRTVLLIIVMAFTFIGGFLTTALAIGDVHSNGVTITVVFSIRAALTVASLSALAVPIAFLLWEILTNVKEKPALA